MATVKCSVCGSTDVQIKMWVKPNEDNEPTTEFIDEIINKKDDCWCCECGSNVTLVCKEAYNNPKSE